MQAGARIVFDTLNQKLLREQWESTKLEPSLRMMIIISALMFQEQGALKLQVNKLLGNTSEELGSKDSPHVYGCAADLAVNNLMDGRMSLEVRKAYRNPRAIFIADRLNSLFPYGGIKKSAFYNLDHIHIEVPIGGSNKNTMALSSWFEDGCDGIQKFYRRRIAS